MNISIPVAFQWYFLYTFCTKLLSVPKNWYAPLIGGNASQLCALIEQLSPLVAQHLQY